MNVRNTKKEDSCKEKINIIVDGERFEIDSNITVFEAVEKMGKYILEVCRTGPCCNVGAEELIHYMEEKLGVACGETTADGLFTIKPVECLAACGSGPVLQIGPDYHYREHLTKEKIDLMIAELKAKG